MRFLKNNNPNIKEYARKMLPYLPAALLAIAVLCILPQYKEGTYSADMEDYAIQTNTETNEDVIDTSATEGTFDLEDGLYQGSGQGYGGEIVVAVEINSKRIANIWILSAEKEDETFLNHAKGVMESIITKQDTDVDVVSGATYSSNGIMEAVKNALSGDSKVGDSDITSAVEALAEATYGTLIDGTYIGEAEGFGGTVKVQVTITDGKIAKIEILSAEGEGADYLSKASSLVNTIIDEQSTNVDVVSGATYTSNGIISAVRNALAKAEGESADTASSDTTAKEGESGKFPYDDGVYYGTGTGFAGDITVAIVIGDATLKAAIVTEASDDDAFLMKAKTILDTVVTQQSTDVDVVSGATYSSNGVIEAVKNAIQAAKDATSKTERVTTSESPTESAGAGANNSNHSSTGASNTKSSGTYKDGTYTVETTCSPNASKAFTAYTLSMTVTIKDDLISAITNVLGTGSSYESINDSFISRAVNGTSSSEGVVTQITSKGTVSDIDVVSGATCTSDAIIAGAKKALQTAKTSSSTSSSVSPSPSPSKATTSSPVTASASPSASVSSYESPALGVIYNDGTYKAQAVCYADEDEEFEDYDLSLTVTISGGKITAISDLSGSGSLSSFNAIFYNQAANGTSNCTGVVAQIIAKQDTSDIDVVSGATCSSKAIINAVKSVLESAK